MVDNCSEITGKQVRTAEEVERTTHMIKTGAFRLAPVWLPICGIVTLASLSMYSWKGALLGIVLAVLYITKSYASYKAADFVNQHSLGTVRTPEKLSGDSEARKIAFALCRKFHIEKPTFSYTGDGFSGFYDPNINLITLGEGLALYETEDALATSVHESAHHILLNEPTRGRRRRLLLEVAGLCNIVSIIAAVAFIICAVIGESSGFASQMFSLFIMTTLLRKAAATTHEYEVNSYIENLFYEDLDELASITDKESAFRGLKLGERTYTTDLIGWMTIAAICAIGAPLF